MELETQAQENSHVEQLGETSPLHQITPVSKYLAMALFIILPFVGGYIGYIYAPEKVVEVVSEVAVEKIVEVPTQPEATDSEINTDLYKLQKPFTLPIDIVRSAPTNCLPEVPQDAREDKTHFYATQADVNAMKTLAVGETYGSFIYEGYVCEEKYSEGLNRTLNAPSLYFTGTVEITGNDIFTEYSGVEHFRISDSDLDKLPELVQSDFMDYPTFKYLSNPDANVVGPSGATTTLVVDAIIYGQVGGGFQSYYGGVTPNVIEVTVLE